MTAVEALATTALASADCTVYRGPFVTGNPGAAFFVGYDGDPAGDFRAVNGSSAWAGLGAKARDEVFEIVCSITLIDGAGDVSGATVDVFAIHALFEAALRNNPSLGQTPRLTAAVVGGELFTMPHPSGLQVRLVFSVQVSARI
jgi:hypothetical protein